MIILLDIFRTLIILIIIIVHKQVCILDIIILLMHFNALKIGEMFYSLLILLYHISSRLQYLYLLLLDQQEWRSIRYFMKFSPKVIKLLIYLWYTSKLFLRKYILRALKASGDNLLVK